MGTAGTVKRNQEHTEVRCVVTVTAGLQREAGIKLLLRDFYPIAERRYTGDYAACDLLLDLQDALKEAKLTDRQREVLSLMYGPRQLTQSETALAAGIAQKNVSLHLGAAVARIAHVFRSWENCGSKTEVQASRAG
ncbi:sigma factor-like helix-turn-helix DNA-binding protein [Gorillibacterium sp. sgz500922]|uniref:sigma factor-like helix-turn-helix DNA-binding protein n=1 Tax=Gorillibacterium sp. sgz500922 TaxID=3446694 RepID=UPI003F67FF14